MTRAKHLQDRLSGMLGDTSPVRHAVKWLSGPQATIFTFHRVLPAEKDCFEPEMSTRVEKFADFLDWIQENYQVVGSLDEIVARNGKPSMKGRPECAITFDDGWYDNFAYAFPELTRRGLTATIFLATRYIGTDLRLWQERLWLCWQELKTEDNRREVLERVARRTPWFPPVGTQGDRTDYGSLRRLLMTRASMEAEEFSRRIEESGDLSRALSGRSFLDWDEVKKMQAAGIRFGSHTLNHTLLPNASPSQAEREIRDSREELAARIKENVTGFAYPWGALGPNSYEQVRQAGYEFAVTTKPGLVKHSSDRFLLPRVSVSDSVLDAGQGTFNPGKARLSFARQIFTASTKELLKRKKKKSDKRIKVLFVLDLIDMWEGGTERQIHLLIRSLDPKYFEPKLCFLFKSPEFIEASSPCPVIVVCRQSVGIPSLPLRIWNLTRVFIKERPDIVQTLFVEGLMIGILAARIAKVPQVIGSVRNDGYWRQLKHRLVMKAVTPLAHRWQTNSRELWSFQNKVEEVPASRIEILPNGTDVSRFNPATHEERQQARRDLGLSEIGPICVSVANLAAVKDLETLIRSAIPLREKLPTIQFLVVGDGPLREDLENLTTSLGLSDTVRFVGRQADVRPFLTAADFGVLTSLSEGSSNSILEYMAMGLPSIVSDLPANRELLKEVLFQPGNPVDLAEKIYRLWQDLSLRTNLSKMSREIAVEYSLEKFSVRAQSYYSRIAS